MTCDSTHSCYILHNGGAIRFANRNFGGSDATNAISFIFDPDGKVTDGTTNGPGKAIYLYLYYNGRINTSATIDDPVCDSSTCYSPNANYDPPWFSWD